MGLPINKGLYKVTDQAQEQALPKAPIKVTLFPADIDIQKLSAYHFHPDRTNIFSKIINILQEFFSEKTAVLVKVEGENKPLYMKVDELSQVLGITSADLKGKSDVEIADYLKMAKTANKLSELTGSNVFSKTQINQSITSLSGRGISTEHIFKLIHSNEFKEFPSAKMAHTLMEIGHDLSTGKRFRTFQKEASQKTFKFEISGDNIFIWEGNKKVDLKTLQVTEAPSKPPKKADKAKPPGIIPAKPQNAKPEKTGHKRGIVETVKSKMGVKSKSPVSKKSKEPPIVSDEDKFRELAKSLGMASTKKTNARFHALSERMSYPTMLKLVNDAKSDADKKIMLNTLQQIGRTITKMHLTSEIYNKSIKKKNELKSHAFAITDHEVYIALSQKKGSKIATGSFKLVTKAIKINNFANQTFAQQIESFVRIKPNPEPMGMKKKKVTPQVLAAINKDLKDEAKLMRERLQNNPYAIQPHSLQTMSPTGKVVLFQSAHSGDGETLFKEAALKQQLNGIIGFGKGLALMHRDKLIHMDVKPANMAFIGNHRDENELVEGRVADVGLAKTEGRRIDGGSPGYLPYEALLPPKFNNYDPNCKAAPSIDSFGYGMLILESIVGIENVPFIGSFSESEFSDVDKYFQDLKDSLKDQPDGKVKAQMVDVAQKLTKFKPKDRLSCQQAVNELVPILTNYLLNAK